MTNRLVQQLIQARRTETALSIRYLLGVKSVVQKQRPMFTLTAKRESLLRLLALTMVSPQHLFFGGIAGTLRHAQRRLKTLADAGYLESISLPVSTRSVQRCYFLSRKIRKPARPYHKIQTATAWHDWLTALFLVHLFRCAKEQDIELDWYPPFVAGSKLTDGGVTLSRSGTTLASFLLETDTGTHDQREIEEKMVAYLPFVAHQPRRYLVFLVQGKERAANIRQTVDRVLAAQQYQARRVKIFCPLAFTPAEAILRVVSAPDTS